MRKLTAVLLVVTFSYTVKAQEMLAEAAFKYSISDIRLRPNGTFSRFITAYAFAYDASEFRTSSEMRANMKYIIVNKCNDPVPVAYVSSSDRSYSFEEPSKTRPFELGRMRDLDATIRYTDESASIRGFDCQKAVMKVEFEGNTEEIEVWYAPAYRIPSGCFDYFFRDLKGLPVSVRFNYYADMQISNLATKHIREYLLDSLFTKDGLRQVPLLPEDKYTRVDRAGRGGAIAEMMQGASRPSPRGTAITTNVQVTGGVSLTHTQFNPFTVGEKMTEFTGVGIDGNIRGSGTTYHDRAMVINFWFTKCAPCIREMPVLNKIAANYTGKNISFISITYNTADELKEFFKKTDFSFDHIAGATDLIDKYGVSSYPATVITDKDHIIKYIKIGSFANEGEIEQEVKKVL